MLLIIPTVSGRFLYLRQHVIGKTRTVCPQSCLCPIPHRHSAGLWCCVFMVHETGSSNSHHTALLRGEPTLRVSNECAVQSYMLLMSCWSLSQSDFDRMHRNTLVSSAKKYILLSFADWGSLCKGQKVLGPRLILEVFCLNLSSLQSNVVPFTRTLCCWSFSRKDSFHDMTGFLTP